MNKSKNMFYSYKNDKLYSYAEVIEKDLHSVIDDLEEAYPTTAVAEELGRSVQTILIWYRAKDNVHSQTKLPTPKAVGNKRLSYYFTREDIDQLKAFRDNIIYGTLADFNKRLWNYEAENPRKHKDGVGLAAM